MDLPQLAVEPPHARKWGPRPGVFFAMALLCVASGLILSAFGVDQLTAFLAMGSMILLCIGLAVLAIRSNAVRRRRLMRVYLVVPSLIIALSVLLRYKLLPGAGIAGILGVFLYCFTYAPVAMYASIGKWQPFARNTWEVFLLSSLDFLSINLILLGLLMYYLTWVHHLYVVYAGIALMLAGLFSWNTRFKQEVVARKQAEDLIKVQYAQIEQEKKLADDLLLNILPAEVAEELKTKGAADPRHFDEVTVLFTDFKGFTAVAEKLSARDLVAEIHACFMAFDRIVEKHGIEKIKTIGDAYMAAGGLPRENRSHAVDVVCAALEIQDFIAARMAARASEGLEAFQIRIGIHTGPVVAGIVGIKKFAYDIWGDTVNTASRMESSGEAGKVNISSTTFQQVKDQFRCTPRGMVQAKGKGEVEMFFVERM